MEISSTDSMFDILCVCWDKVTHKWNKTSRRKGNNRNVIFKKGGTNTQRQEVSTKSTKNKYTNTHSYRMSTPNTGDTLPQLRKVQLTRSMIVQQLSKPNLAELVSGLYVRVLLELENGGEEYKIARVVCVERGSDYSGFTYDAQVSTDRYLVLELSPPAKSDNHYQLNSVSNKEFQATEYTAWQKDIASGKIPRPTDAEFIALQEKIRRLASPAAGGTGAAPLAQSATVNLQGSISMAPNRGGTLRQSSNNAAPVPAPTVEEALPGQTAAGTAADSDDSDDYEQNEDDIQRLVEEERREKHFVVPNDLMTQTTQQLRLLEKDVLDYLDKLRENLDTHSSKCIACLVHEPAVIIMPCKHKVLCRGCCTKVLICPMCRVKIREVFEPVEV